MLAGLLSKTFLKELLMTISPAKYTSYISFFFFSIYFYQLEPIIQSEVSQKDKDKLYFYSFAVVLIKQ